MNRLLLAAAAAVCLLAPSLANAEERKYNPDCKLDAINASLDAVRDQVKSSPALGHAGGHYKKALEDLERTRKQLHEGCHAWNESLKKK